MCIHLQYASWFLLEKSSGFTDFTVAYSGYICLEWSEKQLIGLDLRDIRTIWVADVPGKVIYDGVPHVLYQ